MVVEHNMPLLQSGRGMMKVTVPAGDEEMVAEIADAS